MKLILITALIVNQYSHCKSVLLDKGEMDKIVNIQDRYNEDAHYQKYHYGRRDYDDDYYYYNDLPRREGY
jgi:Zn-finger nucleic acid-binding protein